MKPETTAVFRKSFFLGLFFSVLFLSFFRNIFSSLGGIELFIPLFGIPALFLTVFVAAVILIPRKFKFNTDSDILFKSTAQLFSVYGLVFLFLAFFLLHRFLLRIFFLPEYFNASVLFLVIFLLAFGYMAGIIFGISLKKIKTREQYESGFNGFFSGGAAGCALILSFLLYRPEWMIFLPSVSGFLFLELCFILEFRKSMLIAAFSFVSLIFFAASVLFIFINIKDLIPYSMESSSGKYELARSGIFFNGRYEPFQPEMDHMMLLTAGLQNPKSGKKILIISNENMSSAFSSKIMPFTEKTEILTFSPEFAGLLLSAHPGMKIHAENPVSFLKKHRKGYDLILLCTANYDSLAFQHLYSLEMFRAVREDLDQEGVFAMRLLPPSHKNKNADRILYSTVSKVFPHVLIADGRNRFLLASDHPVTLSPEILDKRMGDSFVSEKKIRFPKNLFSVVGSLIQNKSFVIDGNKMSSKDIMTGDDPLLLYASWKNIPAFKGENIMTKICRSMIRHLIVILLISAVFYLLIRYFMTNHLERKMLFRGFELGMFAFGTFAFFCILLQMRTGRLYSMITALSGFFALGILLRKWIFGTKTRGARGYVFLSGLLPFAAYWLYPESIHLTESLFFAGSFFLGACFRNELDSYDLTDIRWTLFLPVSVFSGGMVGILLLCLIQPCYGIFSGMGFLFLTRLPGMIRRP